MSTDAGVFRAHHSSRWNELNRVIGEWWQHQRSLHELESLDDTILRDMACPATDRGSRRQKHSG